MSRDRSVSVDPFLIRGLLEEVLGCDELAVVSEVWMNYRSMMSHLVIDKAADPGEMARSRGPLYLVTVPYSQKLGMRSRCGPHPNPPREGRDTVRRGPEWRAAAAYSCHACA